MLGKKLSLVVFLMVVLVAVFADTVQANKSVFIISKHSTSQAQAYSIDGNEVTLQSTVDISTYNPGYGAVGNAVWPQKELLFVTYESSPMIVWASTKTLQKVSEFDTGMTDLSGIAIDENKEKIYVVRRYSTELYVYSWDEVYGTIVLEEPNDPNYPARKYHPLTYTTNAHGIALDEGNDFLYVSTDTERVHVYNTNDWSHDHYIDIEVGGAYRSAVGIAVDPNRGYLYTGDWDGHHYLVRTLTSDPYTSVEVEIEGDYYSESLIGVDVDEETGLVYCTTYLNDFRVYDSNLSLQYTETNNIYGPAGVAVGGLYKPPAFYLEKVDVNEACVLPGDYITYKITYGPNGLDHNNVVITDYLPCQVEYINPSDPNYDSNDRTYKWQIGSLSASAPNDFVTLTVYVNLGVEPNGIITNYCEIESDHYCSFAFADTNACFWSPDIIYVDVNAVGCNSGLSWYHADPDLQSALWKAQAWSVNQIRVAEGTYKPTKGSVRSISFELLDDVAIYGGFPSGGGTLSERNPNSYETILSGDIGTPVIDYNDNSYHVVKCEDVNNAVLDGFTITAGNANGSGYALYGGGIFCKDSNDLTVTNCTFSNNSAREGGAVCNYSYSYPKITNCIFTGNTAVNYGGGILNWNYSDANVTNCIFSGNSAGYGGGIENWQSYPTVTNCTFSGNSALSEGASYGKGGGMHNGENSVPNVTNCTFSNNSAYQGGGVYNYYSDPNIINCIFSGNFANADGGGIYNYDDSYPKIANCIFTGNKANNDKGGGIYNSYSEPNITNCIFTGNNAEHYGGGIYSINSTLKVSNSVFAGNIANYYGGGIYKYHCPTAVVTNCTFSGNRAGSGGGIYNWYSSEATLSNCIFWDNEANVGNEIYNISDLSVTYCDVKGGWTGTGNIEEDPLFL